jgi:hypothetical protein
LWEFCQKYGATHCPHLQALKQRFKFIDFRTSSKPGLEENQFLREYEDFTFIAEQVARDLLEQNNVLC